LSDKPPKLNRGDTVRIMQTDEAVANGLANKLGTVQRVLRTHAEVYMHEEKLRRDIPINSLMKHTKNRKTYS
jgi:hypothetical protein